MQQLFSFINLFKSAQHVSGDKLAHPQEHFFKGIYSFWYNAPLLLPIGSSVGALYPKLYVCVCVCVCIYIYIYIVKVLLRMGEFVARNMLG